MAAAVASETPVAHNNQMMRMESDSGANGMIEQRCLGNYDCDKEDSTYHSGSSYTPLPGRWKQKEKQSSKTRIIKRHQTCNFNLRGMRVEGGGGGNAMTIDNCREELMEIEQSARCLADLAL